MMNVREKTTPILSKFECPITFKQLSCNLFDASSMRLRCVYVFSLFAHKPNTFLGSRIEKPSPTHVVMSRKSDQMDKLVAQQANEFKQLLSLEPCLNEIQEVLRVAIFKHKLYKALHEVLQEYYLQRKKEKSDPSHGTGPSSLPSRETEIPCNLEALREYLVSYRMQQLSKQTLSEETRKVHAGEFD